MEEPPLPQTTLSSRSSNFQVQAAKLFQKVSHFRSHIRFTGRKSKDVHGMEVNMGPYLRQTRSMDPGMLGKPYMSQPILGLHHIQHADGNDSSLSESPNGSPTRGEIRKLPTVSGGIGHGGIVSQSRTLPHSTNRAAYIDGLPGIEHETSPMIVTSLSHPTSTGLPSQGHPGEHNATPTTVASAPAVPPKPFMAMALESSGDRYEGKRPRSAGGRSVSSFVNIGIPGRILRSRQSKSKLKPEHDSTPSTHDNLPPSLQTSLNLSIATTSSSSTVTPSMVASASEPPIAGPSALQSDGLKLKHLPSTPHRFNLNVKTEDGYGAARLSPSIITRQPPLPILNLPKLVVSPAREETGEPSGSQQDTGAETSRNASLINHAYQDRPRERRGAGLSSMPALPLQGQDGPRDGDDDVEEGGDMDDDDENYQDVEEEMAGDNDNDDDDRDDDRMPRGSMDSSISGLSGANTPEDPRGRTSNRESWHLLPPVDTSLFDLSFLERSLDPLSVRSPKFNSKERARGPHVDRTPMPHSIEHDYFSPSWSGQPQASTSMSSLRTRGLGGGMGTREVGRPGLYRHASKSMVDLMGMTRVGIKEESEESLERQPAIQRKDTYKGKEKARDDDNEGVGEPGTEERLRKSTPPGHERLAIPQHPPSLQRRRSMPTFNATTDPPPYPSFLPHPYSQRAVAFKVQPRDDEIEGKEQLPLYSNSIYLKAIMPRKMEFIQPGMQAKDRKWRRVVCELEGTVFRVYRCPPGVSGVGIIGEWWEKKVGVGDVTLEGTGSTNTATTQRIQRIEDRVQARISKEADEAASAQVTTQLVVAPPSPSPPTNFSQSQNQVQPPFHPLEPQLLQRPPTSKSRLNLAVNHLLKPHSRPHSRSRSDVPNMMPRSVSTTPRSSLSSPRPSTSTGCMTGSSGNLASQSTSSISNVMPSSSSSIINIPPSSSSSHFRSASSSTTQIQSYSQGQMIPELGPSDLIRAYTLQHAESGLGNDYVKRRNVIRVRMEGEQFLLQAKDVADVVAWIEGFQAATNIALDLDERVMPRGPLFPRRRRRRPRPVPTGQQPSDDPAAVRA